MTNVGKINIVDVVIKGTIQFLFLFVFLQVSQICSASQVIDSTPFFNQCIKDNKVIELRKGMTYYLKSKLIAGNHIVVRGHGAKIVIPETYPVNRYDNIFTLKDSGIIDLKDIEIYCLLKQKFPKKDSIGDTFFISAAKGLIRLRHVNFECRTHYNNVTFVFSTGANIYMDHCHVVNNTLSKQGGILWYMSRTNPIGSIILKNSYFEHDAMDESMCFSVSGIAKVRKCVINASVKNCTYYSPCLSPSSGMIILYNHNNHTFADVSVNYQNCKFICDGANRRRIQTLQCGTDTSWHYGVFDTKFNHCEISYSINQKIDNGLIGLLPSKRNGDIDDTSYTFRNCSFKIHNYGCLIGDKDGACKGKYTFIGCKIESDCHLFQKKYNYGSGNIFIDLDNTSCASTDEVISTEKLSANKSKFTNIIGKKVNVDSKLNSLHNCKVNNQILGL